MTAPLTHPAAPSAGERGLASWEPGDLAGLLLPAWDEFVDLATDIDLDAPTRLPGWTARAVFVHLGSWPGSRSMQRMRDEAERHEVADQHDPAGRRSSVFDQESLNEAVLEARGRAPRAALVEALLEARSDVEEYLSSDLPARLGSRLVRSVLGPLPLTTLVAAKAYEIAVHTLDLAPAGAAPPSTAVLSAGVAALVDTTGGLAARCELSAGAGCVTPEGGWAFATADGAWTTLELPAVPDGWPAVQGRAADILDASAGRRAVPPMLARRDLRLHQVTGLLALAPVVEAVPGLPGGVALRLAVHNIRSLSRLVRKIPGLPV